MSHTTKTFCTICTAFCGFEARVEDDRIVEMVPDAEHPMSRGFSCTKGRQFHHLLTAANRLTSARAGRGDQARDVATDVALDEIAERLAAIRAEHGPESVAIYAGNGATFKTTPLPMTHAWLAGLGSHQMYTSLTIDQPAKVIAAGRVGVWAAGTHDFESADVSIMMGNNVVVSGLNVPGAAPGWRPKAIREAKERGLKLIVVDPRRTQTANLADLHLQIKPGEDATLLAGMIRLVLDSGRQDVDFCEEFVDGVDDLRAAVEPFTLEYVARRTGLDAADIETAVDLFTSGRRGTVSSGTGPDMGPHGNLAEHLIAALNVLCGRFNRAGEVSETLPVLLPDLPSVAAVVPRDFLPDKLSPDKNTHRSRLHGARQVYQEMPTSTLADEILTPGDGQVRALIVVGGNPVTSWPDRAKTVKALESLDLLVCIDVRETDTVTLADYALPASYGLERLELTAYNDYLYNRPFVQFAEAVVPPPGEAREEWVYLAELARRLGTKVELPGGLLDLDDLPDAGGFFDLLYPDGTTRVALEEIRRHEGGAVFEQFEGLEVLSKFEGMDDRFQLFGQEVAAEIGTLLGYDSTGGEDEGFTHLLTCRRNGLVYNSMCHEMPRSATSNPASLHPGDLAALGAQAGQVVRLVSAHGSIDVRLAADDTLRRGVVSVSHGFGSLIGGEQGSDFAGVSELISTETTVDTISRMPILSALPVRFELTQLDR
ncbi:molybdopterin-containing oxidoreductase family protein [Nocardioides sp.]|uniref:molybdopterin-containing oxidoreductase family protein n=1 Tax=Nocardioides sp. TaxID=35761 RepID=UPI002B26AE37|nr:molybdopterin-dependent oxidoreductase [Nocardioides sp.]